MFLYRVSMKVRRHLFASFFVVCGALFVVTYIGFHNSNTLTSKPVRQKLQWHSLTKQPTNQTSVFTVHGTAPSNEDAVKINKSKQVTPKSPRPLFFSRETKMPLQAMPVKAKNSMENVTFVHHKLMDTRDRNLMLDLSKNSESLQPPSNLLKEKLNSKHEMPLKTRELQSSIEKQHELYLKAYQDVVRRNQVLEKGVNAGNDLHQDNGIAGIPGTRNSNVKDKGDNKIHNLHEHSNNKFGNTGRGDSQNRTGSNVSTVHKVRQTQQLPYEVESSFLTDGKPKFSKGLDRITHKDTKEGHQNSDAKISDGNGNGSSHISTKETVKSVQKGSHLKTPASLVRNKAGSTGMKHSGTKFRELHVRETAVRKSLESQDALLYKSEWGEHHKHSHVQQNEIPKDSSIGKQNQSIRKNEQGSIARNQGDSVIKKPHRESVAVHNYKGIDTNYAHQNSQTYMQDKTDFKKTSNIAPIKDTLKFKDTINVLKTEEKLNPPLNRKNSTFRNDMEIYHNFIKKVVNNNVKRKDRNRKPSLLDKYIFPVHKTQEDNGSSDWHGDNYQKHQIHDGLQNYEKFNDLPQKELSYKFQSDDVHHDNIVDLRTTNDEEESRPEKCNGCMRLDFKYLVNGSTICKKDAKSLDLVILVSSDPVNDIARMAIRKTWGEVCHKKSSNIACVFLIANSLDAEQNRLVLEESRRYRDMVVFSFMDAYTNLTYKTVMGLQWSKDYCPMAKFIMKTDQDVFVNTHQIPIMLQAAPSEGFAGGFCWGLSRPHRDPSNKWYVSYDQFASEFFPPMCSGTGYVISRDVVISILKVSPNIPFFNLEDVYIALCLQKLGITPINMQGFSNMRVDFQPCEYKHYVMTSHQISESELTDFWEDMQTCPDHDFSPQDLYFPLPLSDID